MIPRPFQGDSGRSRAYLLELSRYVVLNPVRAGMVNHPANWPWSSYRASMGLVPALTWLAADELLAQFAKRRSAAHQCYAQFVMAGIKAASPWTHLTGQVFLGDAQFVERMQAQRPFGQQVIKGARLELISESKSAPG